MRKTKLTLTVDREVINEAKSRLANQNTSISKMVENFLRSYTNSWIDRLMKDLGIKKRYISYESIVRSRRSGADAGKIVRSIRNARAVGISRH